MTDIRYLGKYARDDQDVCVLDQPPWPVSETRSLDDVTAAAVLRANGDPDHPLFVVRKPAKTTKPSKTTDTAPATDPAKE